MFYKTSKLRVKKQDSKKKKHPEKLKKGNSFLWKSEGTGYQEDFFALSFFFALYEQYKVKTNHDLFFGCISG
jgi:hypothetical protein